MKIQLSISQYGRWTVGRTATSIEQSKIHTIQCRSASIHQAANEDFSLHFLQPFFLSPAKVVAIGCDFIVSPQKHQQTAHCIELKPTKWCVWMKTLGKLGMHICLPLSAGRRHTRTEWTALFRWNHLIYVLRALWPHFVFFFSLSPSLHNARSVSFDECPATVCDADTNYNIVWKSVCAFFFKMLWKQMNEKQKNTQKNSEKWFVLQRNQKKSDAVRWSRETTTLMQLISTSLCL